MTNRKEIEIWWNKSLKKYCNYMGAIDDLINYLDNYIKQLPEKDKQAIIEFLTDKTIKFADSFRVACWILEKHCNAICLDKIFKFIKKLKLTDENIIYPMRVICQQGNDKHRQLLERFFSPDKLNGLETFVHWALYPKFPDLFVKSYSKHLKLTDYKQWTGSGTIQSFMFEPIALGLLKDYLEKTDKKTWNLVLKDIKTELTKDFWTKRQKKEVRKIISASNSALLKAGQTWLNKLFHYK